MKRIDLESLDPLDPEIVENPYEFYRALRERGPVYRVPGRRFFLVSHYETAVRVMRDPETFSSGSGVAVPMTPDGGHPPPRGQVNTLLTADPPEHRKYRELVNRAFSLGRVASWEGAIRDVTDALIDGFVESGRCELVHDFAVPLPLIVICDALGLPREKLRTFKEWSDGISRFGGMLSAEETRRVHLQMREFSDYVDAMIADRRRHLGDDFISDLLAAKFDGERALEPAELNSIATQFLVAGNETTTNTIASGMWLLLTHPEQLEAVRGDASRIPNLIEEVLRFESPVQAHFRVATCDTELEGVAIPSGAGVGLLFGCCNRDPAQFADPDVFDVRRENAARHLAFGKGMHFCPGAPLARLELRIAFEHLLARLEGVRLDDVRSDLRHVPSFTHRGLRALALEFQPGGRLENQGSDRPAARWRAG